MNKASDEDIFAGPYRAPGEKEEDLPLPIPPKPKKPNSIVVWYDSAKKSAQKAHRHIMDNWGEYLFAVTLLTAICIVFWTLIRFISASNEPTHCYIEYYIGQSQQYGAVPFSLRAALDMQPDDTLGRFKEFDEAVAAAKKIGCNLK